MCERQEVKYLKQFISMKGRERKRGWAKGVSVHIPPLSALWVSGVAGLGFCGVLLPFGLGVLVGCGLVEVEEEEVVEEEEEEGRGGEEVGGVIVSCWGFLASAPGIQGCEEGRDCIHHKNTKITNITPRGVGEEIEKRKKKGGRRQD